MTFRVDSSGSCVPSSLRAARSGSLLRSMTLSVWTLARRYWSDSALEAASPPTRKNAERDEDIINLRIALSMLFRYRTLTRARLRPQSHPLILAINRTSHATGSGEIRDASHHCRGKAERRPTCSAILNIFVTARPSVARSATGNLASCGIIPGAPRSAQRSVLPVSGHVGKPTANGCSGFTLPDNLAHGFRIERRT